MNGHKVVFLCLLGLLLSTVVHAKIIFSSERDGVAGKQSGGVKGIYLMDDDGSNLTLLTEDDELRPYPNCWSPDGQQIVFQKRVKPHSNYSIFVMNADGANVRQLTDNDDSSVGRASFSPDGKSLVFGRHVRVDNTTKFSITVLNIETGGLEKISDTMAAKCDWSPDGKHILYNKGVALGGGGATIWIIDAEGHNPRPLIPPPQQAGVTIFRSSARWSPDGQQIVFTQKEYVWKRIPNLGVARIYQAHRYMICDRNGENIEQLQIPKDWECYGIDWMDDGNSVVFSAREGMPLNEPIPLNFVWPPCYIYKYHIWTKKITQLTDDPGWDQTIDWISDDVLPVSPQGKKKVTWGTLKQ